MGNFITNFIGKVKKKMLAKLIQAIIAALVPILYSLLSNWIPNFPLLESDLFNLLVWIASYFVAGGKAKSAMVEYKKKN
ncbi:MAG: hypothetical protein M0R06_10560 [Sphaerochaeta sp.]|nr:hypothetical protein [Sphaerochaeta sp.]